MRQRIKQRPVPAALVVAGPLLFWLASLPAEGQCTGCPKPSFGPAALGASFGAAQIFDVVSGDVNLDGLLDLVASADSVTSNGSLRVLYGAGGGEFQLPVVLQLPLRLQELTMGDFTNDGRLDLIGSNGFQSGLTLLRGNSAGGFDAPDTVASSTSTYWLASGDFNGDANRDVAATDGNSASTVQFFFGNGTGLFSAPVNVPAGPGISSLSAADFNGDGREDLVATNAGASSISVILGVASPPFAPATNYVVGTAPVSSASADFDSDGKMDLAVSSSQNGLSVLLGTGSGTFGAPAHFPSSWGSAVTGDFNGDAKSDVALVGQGELKIFTGNGAGSFAVARSAGWYGIPLPGDFSGDGIGDLVVMVAISQYPANAEGNAFLLRGTPAGLRTPLGTGLSESLFNPRGIVSGNFNGDGAVDVAVFGLSGQTQILLGTGSGDFVAGQLLNHGGSPTDLAVADLNADGRSDLIVAEFFRISVYLAGPTGQFGSPSSHPLESGQRRIATGDLNLDTVPDLIVSTANTNSIQVFLGAGGGTFQPSGKYGVGSQPDEVVIGRLDADPYPDAILIVGENVTVMRGNGVGGFLSIEVFPAGYGARSPALGDFNGDGGVDVALLTSDTFFPPHASISLFLGDGSGSLAPAATTPLSNVAQDLAASDFNQDGTLDLFVAGPGAGSIYQNTGGAFEEAARYWVGLGFFSAAVADFLADGLPDIAVSGDVSRTVVTLPNTNCRPVALLTTGPTGCFATGLPFATQPVVEVQDDGGNRVTCASGTVTASIVPGTGAPGAVLLGDTTAPAAGGVAAFSDLAVDRAGAGYRLVFSHPAAGTARSRAFSVTDATVSVPNFVCPFSAGHTASVPDAGPGATYVWTVVNGQITSGAGTRSIGFRAGPYGEITIGIDIGREGCSVTATRIVFINPSGCPPPLGYFTVLPCRLLDTREPPGPGGGPAVSAGESRLVGVSNRCGLPATARALSLNVTVTEPSHPGYVTIFPGSTPFPPTSTVNYRPGQTRANNAIIPVGAAGDLTVSCGQLDGTVQVILDVNGYFE